MEGEGVQLAVGDGCVATSCNRRLPSPVLRVSFTGRARFEFWSN